MSFFLSPFLVTVVECLFLSPFQDPNAEETVAWVEKQVECFEHFMSRCELRQRIKEM